MADVRVGLDATPLLGPRTGVGRYVEGLLGGLLELPDPPDLRLTGFTWRGLAALSGPAGTTVARRRAPARLLQAAWLRSSLPPVELLSGAVEVFHGTNFVLPPTARAGGVLTVHDLSFLHHADTVRPASLPYQRLVPRALARGCVVVCPSETVAAEVRATYRLAVERVVATPLGVDPSWCSATPLDPAELSSRGLPERYLLFVGTREPRKNLAVLLRAVALLRENDPDAPPLVLAGPAGWGEEGSVLPAGVIPAGYLEPAGLQRLVAGAAALVLPSRYEGFGLPVLEALACGVAVVTSDLPVFREVAGDLAETAPAGDAEQLAAALARALPAATPDPAVVMARRDRAAQFTWRRCAHRTLAAYRQAADERAGARPRRRPPWRTGVSSSLDQSW